MKLSDSLFKSALGCRMWNLEKEW